MGEVSSAFAGQERGMSDYFGKPEGKLPLGRPRHIVR